MFKARFPAKTLEQEITFFQLFKSYQQLFDNSTTGRNTGNNILRFRRLHANEILECEAGLRKLNCE